MHCPWALTGERVLEPEHIGLKQTCRRFFQSAAPTDVPIHKRVSLHRFISSSTLSIFSCYVSAVGDQCPIVALVTKRFLAPLLPPPIARAKFSARPCPSHAGGRRPFTAGHPPHGVHSMSLLAQRQPGLNYWSPDIRKSRVSASFLVFKNALCHLCVLERSTAQSTEGGE